MSQQSYNIDGFASRVRQLIGKVIALKKENNDLYAMVDERDREITALKEQLKAQKSDYDSLFIAKVLNVTDSDMDTTKKRINRMIRTVNQCITLLSEQKQ